MSSLHSPIIESYNLRKDYEMPTGKLSVLKGVNFEMRRGEMTFIVGRSGAGKSTLLHLVGGLDYPTSGKILFEGADLTRLDEREMSRLRNQRIGFVFQFYHLLPELTLFENVLLPMLIAGKPDRKWVKEMLRKMKLLSRQDHYPSELSGGEKQRAAIARSLVNKPSVVLCDEPTGNLDDETAQDVCSLLTELNHQEGQTFVIVTHDESWAWRHTRVFRMQEGLLIPENRDTIPIEQIR